MPQWEALKSCGTCRAYSRSRRCLPASGSVQLKTSMSSSLIDPKRGSSLKNKEGQPSHKHRIQTMNENNIPCNCCQGKSTILIVHKEMKSSCGEMMARETADPIHPQGHTIWLACCVQYCAITTNMHQCTCTNITHAHAQF